MFNSYGDLSSAAISSPAYGGWLQDQRDKARARQDARTAASTGREFAANVPWGLKAAGAMFIPGVGPVVAAGIAAKNI